jgi:hypothetical protein
MLFPFDGRAVGVIARTRDVSKDAIAGTICPVEQPAFKSDVGSLQHELQGGR